MNSPQEDGRQGAGELHVPALQEHGGKIGPFPGEIAKQIGSGDHAQYAIVYRTIFWCFVAGGLLSLAVFIYAFARDATPPTSIKDVWSVFAPIITLALGYLFGKGK